jgi:hypothetical protein
MKLATVLHSLGLTGPVLHLSKTIIPVDTYIKEAPIAQSHVFWPLLLVSTEFTVRVMGPGTVTDHTPLGVPFSGVSFSSYVTLSPQAGLVIAASSTQNPNFFIPGPETRPRLQASHGVPRFRR